MKAVHTVTSLSAAGLFLLAGCGKREQPAAGQSAAPSAPTVAPGNATVTGQVKFVGKAPENPAIDMSEEAKCKASYTTQPRQHVVMVNPNGTLADVFVYVKAGLPEGTYPVPATPVEIDQQGCMYHPRVFGIMVGQTLAIKNSDPLLHNIKAMGKANRPFNISQPTANMTTDRTFTAREVMLPFECNVHGWMHAYAGVLPYPYFATTGSDGKFTIANLPAGTYTIEAWQENYGTLTDTVTVAANATKTVDFTYKAK